MANPKDIENKIQSAAEKFVKEQSLNTTPIPAKPDFDFAIQLDKFLDTPDEKFYLAYFIHSLATEQNDKQKSIDYAKKIFEDTKGNKDLLSGFTIPQMLHGSGAKFVYQVSPLAYQSFIDQNPIEFYKSKNFLLVQGVDPSLKPSTDKFEAAVNALPPKDQSPEILEGIVNPELRKSVLNNLSLNPQYALKILEAQIQLKKDGKDYDDVSTKSAFQTVSGYNPQDLRPVPVGTSITNPLLIAKYGPLVYSAEDTKKMLISAAQMDPINGIQYASQNYPESEYSIPVYLTSLPRAKELLDKKENASFVIDLLNKLEPSQYAGTDFKLIPEKDIFKMLDGATSTQLYNLICDQNIAYTYEMTQGVYNEVTKRLYDRLKVEGKTFSDLALDNPDLRKKLDKFLISADVFHRMDNLVKSTTVADHSEIAEKMFADDQPVLPISTVCDFIKNLPKNSPVLPYIESGIIRRASQGDNLEKANMGIIARWYANESGHSPSPDHKEFFDKVKSDPTFDVPPLKSVPSTKLLDAAGRNFQLHIFYNDKDGIDTYKSMSASLKSDGFKEKQQDDFVIFTKERNGKKIEILVSPPEGDGAAIPHMVDYVKGKNGVVSLLSGRGHAHHMEKAVGLITPDIKIVSLGGCWGHQYTSAVLDKSPDAHILATTGIGRMAINNFNTKWMNDQILSGRDLNWQGLKTEWDKLKSDKTIASDLKEYVSPDENSILLYEKRLREIHKIIDSNKDDQKPSSQLNDSFMQSVRGQRQEAGTTTNTSEKTSELKREVDMALTV